MPGWRMYGQVAFCHREWRRRGRLQDLATCFRFVGRQALIGRRPPIHLRWRLWNRTPAVTGRGRGIRLNASLRQRPGRELQGGSAQQRQVHHTRGVVSVCRVVYGSVEGEPSWRSAFI